MKHTQKTQHTMLNIQTHYECDIGGIEIIRLLGAGTQGEVYEVKLEGTPMALKLYFQHQVDHDILESIQSLIDIGAPNKHFLWPSYIITVLGYHGYLMPLIDQQYFKMSRWVKRDFDMNFSEIITACLQLTEAFHQLHAKGLSYQDISLNNVLINPKTGDVLIIDNDNVTTNNQTISGISGTPGFMAPEIVEGETLIPNADTDRYSLLVFLFHLLMVHHPFHGQIERSIKCFDDHAILKLYGHQGVFIFDPHDLSNRPDNNEQKGVNALWNLYPKEIRDLFIRGFTEGHRYPNKRPRESEIKRVFIKFKQSLFSCSCGQEQFYDLNYLKTNGALKPCLCGKIADPPRMKVNQDIVIIGEKNPVLDMYLNPQIDVDLSKPILVFHSNQKKINLTNHLNETIQIKTSNELHDVMPTESKLIENGDQLLLKGHVAYVRIP